MHIGLVRAWLTRRGARSYVFSPAVFDVIAHAIANKMHGPRSSRRSISSVDSFFVDPDEPRDFVRLDGDILTPYAGKKVRIAMRAPAASSCAEALFRPQRLFVYETGGFWDQARTGIVRVSARG
jgi:hypothetical protein